MVLHVSVITKRVLKVNLDFHLLRMKFAMQQLKSAWSWTIVSFTKTNAGLFSEQYFQVSYLWVPTGVQFFHCSNILLHSLMRAGISQGFPSLPRRESKTSVSHSETAQCGFIVSVEHSEQTHLNTFGDAKPSFIQFEMVNFSLKPWMATVSAALLCCALSAAVKGSFRGSWSRLEHSLCSQSKAVCKAVAIFTTFLLYAG